MSTAREVPRDNTLKELLLTQDNLSTLEEILEADQQRLEQLKSLKVTGVLDFGKAPRESDLKGFYDDVRSHLDSFLDIPDIRDCEIAHAKGSILWKLMMLGALSFTGYCALSIPHNITIAHNNSDVFGIGMGLVLTYMAWLAEQHFHKKSAYHHHRGIVVKKESEVESILTIAHEYTHHIIHELPLTGPYMSSDEHVDSQCTCVFEEGIGRGVERHMANVYAEEQGNEAFLYKMVDKHVAELRSAYRWVCGGLGVKPKKDLFRIRTSRYPWTTRTFAFFNGHPRHVLGDALFSILEAEHGPEMYQKILQGDFSFFE